MLFEHQRYGQKNGQGFYRYTPDKKGKPVKEQDKSVDALLLEIANGSRTFTAQEIIARMMIQMVNEVARCLEEGIVASPAEADMALVYGLGFPPFHSGACRYLDTLGSRDYALQANALESLEAIYQIPDGLPTCRA